MPVAGHHSSPSLTVPDPFLSAEIWASLNIYSQALTEHVLHNWHISLAGKANEGDVENIFY